MNRPTRRALRTLLQLIAAGGLTALVSVLADGLSPYWAGVVTILAGVVVTFTQNYLESTGTIPTILPTAPAEFAKSGAQGAESLPLVRR